MQTEIHAAVAELLKLDKRLDREVKWKNGSWTKLEIERIDGKPLGKLRKVNELLILCCRRYHRCRDGHLGQPHV